MFQTAVGRVRGVGLVEGVSFILLMFVAMPLKYLSAYPDLGKQVVFWVGAVHGGLFVLYAAVTFAAWGKGALTAKLVGLAALASIMPFGPFIIDPKLKSHELATKPGPASEPDTPAAQR